MNEANGFISLDEAAEYLKMSRKSLIKMMKKYPMPIKKIWGKWKTKTEWLDEWVKKS